MNSVLFTASDYLLLPSARQSGPAITNLENKVPVIAR